MPPPAFIGGAELTEAAFASILSEHSAVSFYGCSTDPRDWSHDSIDWLRRCCMEASLADPLHAPARWRWRDVDVHLEHQDHILTAIAGSLREVDLVWTSQEGCEEVATLVANKPIVTYAHSVSSVGLMSGRIGADLVLAPSRFVKERIADVCATSATVIRPPVERCDCRVRAPDSLQEILFVNPVPEKGVSIALAIASALPEYNFTLIDGWKEGRLTEERIAPNVRQMGRRNSLHQEYLDSTLLIVPSLVEDAAPRVVTEAGLHGRPAIGSDRGGIPELIPSSDLLLPPEDIDAWVEAIREVTQSHASWEYYARLQMDWSHDLMAGQPDVQSLIQPLLGH